MAPISPWKQPLFCPSAAVRPASLFSAYPAWRVTGAQGARCSRSFWSRLLPRSQGTARRKGPPLPSPLVLCRQRHNLVVQQAHGDSDAVGLRPPWLQSQPEQLSPGLVKRLPGELVGQTNGPKRPASRLPSCRKDCVLQSEPAVIARGLRRPWLRAWELHPGTLACENTEQEAERSGERRGAHKTVHDGITRGRTPTVKQQRQGADSNGA